MSYTWEDRILEKLQGEDFDEMVSAVREISENDTGSNTALEYELAAIILKLVYEDEL